MTSANSRRQQQHADLLIFLHSGRVESRKAVWLLDWDAVCHSARLCLHPACICSRLLLMHSLLRLDHFLLLISLLLLMLLLLYALLAHCMLRLLVVLSHALILLQLYNNRVLLQLWLTLCRGVLLLLLQILLPCFTALLLGQLQGESSIRILAEAPRMAPHLELAQTLGAIHLLQSIEQVREAVTVITRIIKLMSFRDIIVRHSTGVVFNNVARCRHAPLR